MSARLDGNGSRRSRLPLDVVLVTLGSLLLSLVASATLVVATAPSAAAAAAHPARPTYTCYGYCSGINKWDYGTSATVLGTEDEMQTQPLYGASGQYIGNSEWLVDAKQGDTCQNQAFSWIEAGYITRTGTSGTWYYWSDCRPGSPQYWHYAYTVPSGDYGNYFWWWIAAAGTSRWYLYMAADSSGSTPIWSGLSTGNSMSPQGFQSGEVTSNNQVTSSTTYTYYRRFRYEDSSSTWNWQNTDGSTYNTNPPSFGWNQPPSGYGGYNALGNTCWC